MKNIVSVGIISLSLLLFFGSFNTLGYKRYQVKRVVIDAGHGGKDPGTSGSFSKEKDVSLKIALELGLIINTYLPDVEVIFTRDDNTFVDLKDRANIANKNSADVFISIHCNAEPSKNAFGTETYVMGLSKAQGNLEVAKRENSVILQEENYLDKYDGFDPNSPDSHIIFSLYQNAFLGNSLKLAEKVEFQFQNRVGRKSRGVKQAPFLVLWASSMPSILVEVGFLSNPKEEKYLNDELGRTYVASGIFRALRDYKVEIEAMN